MKVKDVMTKNVIAVKKEDTVEDVINILLENKISGAPVVNTEGEVIGVVSESDLIFRDKDLRLPAFIPIFEAVIFLESVKKLEDQIRKKVGYKVEDIMTSPAFTVNTEDDIEKVANSMITKKANRMPVVNDEGKLMGIITRSDILKTF